MGIHLIAGACICRHGYKGVCICICGCLWICLRMSWGVYVGMPGTYEGVYVCRYILLYMSVYLACMMHAHVGMDMCVCTCVGM